MTKILTVNYNTPKLIEKLIESYYKYKYDKYQLIIIDGSDIHNNITKSKELSEKYPEVIFDFVGYNIHHGPGLHYGMNKYKSDFFLLIDSDLVFKKEGYIDYCLENIKNNYGIGKKIKVNKWDQSVRVNGNIDYLHPNGCLINYKMYNNFKPLFAHGAPFLNTMKDLYKKNLSHLIINNNSIRKLYVDEGGRGTVTKFGYNGRIFNKLNKKFGLT
jgi:hypothetical protein